MLDKMDKVLDWFGEDGYRERLERVRRFWDGEGRSIVSVTTSKGFYRQLFDVDAMCGQIPENLESQAMLPGTNLPSVFGDFGTVSTAKYWGGETRFPSDGSKDIFIEPVAQTVEQALALDPLAVDGPDMDAAQGIALFRKACEQLQTDHLWLRTPDMQGPLNTTALVMNQEEMLMAPYTERESLVALLDKVTDFLIAYAQYLRDETNNRVCGNIWPYTFFPSDVGVSLTEDIMPLLSPEVYAEFGIPCLERLSDALGGLHIHCCGEWGRHAEALAASRANIKAMEFHYPYTKIEELMPLIEKGVAPIPYIAMDRDDVEFQSVTEYYDHLLASTDARARFWFAFPEDTEEAIEFAEKMEKEQG